MYISIQLYFRVTDSGAVYKYYFIEIILIGVLFYEYIDYTLNFKPYLSFVYNFLNKNRNSKFKSQIDIIRGKVNTSLYTIKNSKSNSKATSYNIDDFCKLIKWLDATYDFKDEVIRLKIWYKFLKTKSTNYISFFFDFALNHVKYMKKLGEDNLINYLPNLENYLNTYRKHHYNKEDIIYCGKGSVQYYFNMIFSELMNDIFTFLSSNFYKTTNSNKTGSTIHNMIQEKTGCEDPYINEKIAGNKTALKYLPAVKEVLKKNNSLT